MAIRIFGFRPVLVPTLITGAAVVLALGLGTWQIQRLFWKRDLIAGREAALAAPPIDLPDRFDPGAHHFRRVRITGTYLHGAEMYLAARSRRGNAGYHVLTPMRLGEGSHLLVNRGWVPLDRKAPETRAEGQTEGRVEIVGILRRPPGGGWLVPDNEPERNFWFTVDLDAMARHAGLDGFRGRYVEVQQPAHDATYPLAGQTRIDLPNNHLQYVITWYAVAIAAIVIYILWHRKRERENAEE